MNLLLPPGSKLLIGRRRELELLYLHLQSACAGIGATVLLDGEPGVGKTHLAEELARRATGLGVRVLWGRCYAGETAPAFWPWLRIILACLQDAQDGERPPEIATAVGIIARLVPELSDYLRGSLPEAVADSRFPDDTGGRQTSVDAASGLSPRSSFERFRLFDSVVTLLRSSARMRPHLLILDDLQDADALSLLLLQFLGREVRDIPLLLVATYRDTEVGPHHPLEPILKSLARDSVMEHMHLHGLNEAEVSHFISVTAGQTLPASWVAGVWRETGGNPFFIAETIRLLASEGQLARVDGQPAATMVLPRRGREVIDRRLQHLSPTCRTVLTMAAVSGREFGLAILERSGVLAGEELLEALDEALAARLIEREGDTLSRYRFAHDLIRETLYEGLPETERVRLHRRVAETLERLHGPGRGRYLAEIAHHYLRAAPGGDVQKAVNYATHAAERATRLLAYEEAVSHYQHALEALELCELDQPTQQCELFLALGEACYRAGEVERAREAFLEAAEAARSLASPEHLARAALGFSGDGSAAGRLEELCV
ncbi:MAG: ATP-binding protein, partial [Dehalococcoidia bacterium]